MVHTLIHDHPRNFLFALEEGNLLKEQGKNTESADCLHKLLIASKEGKYPNAHMEVAYFSLGEARRAQGKLQEALQAYDSAASTSSNTPDYRQRALLAKGEVSDLLAKRQEALSQYQAAIALDSSSEAAATARKYLIRLTAGNETFHARFSYKTVVTQDSKGDKNVLQLLRQSDSRRRAHLRLLRQESGRQRGAQTPGSSAHRT